MRQARGIRMGACQAASGDRDENSRPARRVRDDRHLGEIPPRARRRKRILQAFRKGHPVRIEAHSRRGHVLRDNDGEKLQSGTLIRGRAFRAAPCRGNAARRGACRLFLLHPAAQNRNVHGGSQEDDGAVQGREFPMILTEGADNEDEQYNSVCDSFSDGSRPVVQERHTEGQAGGDAHPAAAGRRIRECREGGTFRLPDGDEHIRSRQGARRGGAPPESRRIGRRRGRVRPVHGRQLMDGGIHVEERARGA